jgi:tight adherence protein C
VVSLIPIVASSITAAGFGTAVGLIVLGRKREAPVVADGTAEIPDAAGVEQRSSFADFARRILPTAYARMLERQIVLAGRPATWTMNKVLVAKPALTALLAVLALWFINGDPSSFRIGISLFAVVLGFFVPDLLVYSRGVERQKKVQLELPDTLDQMTISVEAGLGFEAAMAKAATNGNGPLAEELIRTLQDMSMGRTRRAAYESLSERTTCTDLRRFVRAVIQADVYGVPIVDVLRIQAGEMRLKRRQRAEEKAMKVPVLVLFPLLFCILPVLFIVILAPAAINVLKTFSG